MSKFLFSIFDTKSRLFGAPVLFASKGEAIRSFSALINDSKADSLYFKYPSDFEIYQLAEFNADTAEIFLTPKELVITGSDVKESSVK